MVEKIAKYSGRAEFAVAREAIDLTQESAAGKGAGERAAHVGFYLIGEGVGQLERAVGARLPTAEALGRAGYRSPLLLYVGGIVMITLALTGVLGGKARGAPVDVWILGLIAVVLLFALLLVFGQEVNGARLWIRLGPIQYEPIELIKLFIVFFLAAYLAETADVIGNARTW